MPDCIFTYDSKYCSQSYLMEVILCVTVVVLVHTWLLNHFTETKLPKHFWKKLKIKSHKKIFLGWQFLFIGLSITCLLSLNSVPFFYSQQQFIILTTKILKELTLLFCYIKVLLLVEGSISSFIYYFFYFWINNNTEWTSSFRYYISIIISSDFSL